mgnify:CR=1 FL=1
MLALYEDTCHLFLHFRIYAMQCIIHSSNFWGLLTLSQILVFCKYYPKVIRIKGSWPCLLDPTWGHRLYSHERVWKTVCSNVEANRSSGGEYLWDFIDCLYITGRMPVLLNIQFYWRIWECLLVSMSKHASTFLKSYFLIYNN